MNDRDQALVALHELLAKADGAQSHWLDWSRGSQARSPEGLVEIRNNCDAGEADRTFVRSRILLDLFRDGLINLGHPRLHGLTMTEAGAAVVKKLQSEHTAR